MNNNKTSFPTSRVCATTGGLDLISGGFGGFGDSFAAQNGGYVRDGNTETGGGIGGALFDTTLSKGGQSKQVVTHVILRGERILYTADIVHDEYEPITKSRITELVGDRGVILFRFFIIINNSLSLSSDIFNREYTW